MVKGTLMQSMGRLFSGLTRDVFATGITNCRGSLSGAVAGAFEGAQRRGLRVLVYRNQAEKAIKELQRKLITENVLKEWKDAQFFTPPSERRVLKRKEGEKRRRRKEFKHMLGIVLAQKERGY
eukprot:jgi/Botrbrau1/5883/Bobra.0366s0061.1